MKLGLEDRKKAIWATALGVLALGVLAYEFVPMFIGAPSTAASYTPAPLAQRTATHSGSKTGKKAPVRENLDPTLQLNLLAASEQTKYSGSGRNIFVSQAEEIPQPNGPGVTDPKKVEEAYHAPATPPPTPIPLKFFGFANQPGEPKKIFLSQGEDVFIAGEGEIVDRRYKVLRIAPNSVEIQDVVNSGPPQNIPLTQG